MIRLRPLSNKLSENESPYRLYAKHSDSTAIRPIDIKCEMILKIAFF